MIERCLRSFDQETTEEKREEEKACPLKEEEGSSVSQRGFLIIRNRIGGGKVRRE